MGGTDLIDQRCSYYRFEHRSTKWQHRLLSHFNSVAVVNSYILWKESKPDERNKVTQQEYMVILMKELTEHEDEVEEQAEEELPTRKPIDNLSRSSTWVADHSRLSRSHTPCSKSSTGARE